MASTLTRILLHITFSTKERRPYLIPAIEADLYAYIGGICRRMKSPLLAMGGTEDHVHLLVSLAKTIPLCNLMLELKRDSSKWISAALRDDRFAWQEGYYAFSIGESGVADLRRYIANQKDHHRKLDFRDEMRVFFRKYGIEWNEDYVWG